MSESSKILYVELDAQKESTAAAYARTTATRSRVAEAIATQQSDIDQLI
jgi:hypothetical protein